MAKATKPSDTARGAAAAGALAFTAVAPITYALQRLIERARSGPVDPSLILKSTHVDYVWRVTLAAWVGGAAALLVWLWVARRRDARFAMQLGIAAAVLGVVTAALSFRFP